MKWYVIFFHVILETTTGGTDLGNSTPEEPSSNNLMKTDHYICFNTLKLYNYFFAWHYLVTILF